MNTTQIKLGDTVSALYGDTRIVALVDGFVGRDILVVLTGSADLGFRVATKGEGLAIRRSDITGLIEAGPTLTEDDVFVSLEIGGAFLR